MSLGDIEINVKYSLKGGPTVLFIHFSGGNLNMWDGVIPLFAADYSIVVPDIRGHGKSDKPMAGYHIDDMAQDLYLLMYKLGVEKCHVVGSSMGAEIGLSLAAAHPELVLSLICEGALCNEFGEYGLYKGTEEEIEHKKEALKKELAKREERIFKTIEDYVVEEQRRLEKMGIWTEHFRPFLENNLQQIDADKFTYCYLNRVRTEYITKYWDLKFEEYYNKVKCPVLFLPSEEEGQNEVIRKSLSEFSSLLDAYEIEHIEKSHHAYVWMQLPDVAGNVAKRFISKYGQ